VETSVGVTPQRADRHPTPVSIGVSEGPEGPTVSSVPVVFHVIAVILAGTGFTLIIDGYRRRPRRPDLTERLLPFKPKVVLDILDTLGHPHEPVQFGRQVGVGVATL
jgi:hypothetical protein